MIRKWAGQRRQSQQEKIQPKNQLPRIGLIYVILAHIVIRGRDI